MKPSLALLALIAPLLTANGQSDASESSIGQVLPDFKLLTVLRGDGRERLSAFYGQPILISYYSTVGAGMNAVRVTTKLDEAYRSKGLITILMEIKQSDPVCMLALALHNARELDCRLLKTQKLPFKYQWDAGPPPGMALIGVDGTLLAAGTYQQAAQIEDLLELEVKKRKQGWGEHPKVHEARALAYGADKLGEAQNVLQAALEQEPGQAELQALEAEFARRFQALKASIPFLESEGEILRAQQRAEELAKSCAMHAEWSAQAQAELARFGEPELIDALAADKKLTSLLKPLLKKGPKKGQDTKLQSFAKSAQDPRVGERALRFAAAVQYALENDVNAK